MESAPEPQARDPHPGQGSKPVLGPRAASRLRTAFWSVFNDHQLSHLFFEHFIAERVMTQRHASVIRHVSRHTSRAEWPMLLSAWFDGLELQLRRAIGMALSQGTGETATPRNGVM